MNSEVKNNIRSEMKEMKERLDTLTVSLEENKDEGQLLCRKDLQTQVYNSPRKVTLSVR